MNGPARSARQRPYWVLAVLAVLLLSPPGPASAALIMGALGIEITVRALAARAAPPQALKESSEAGAVVLGSDAGGKRVLLSDHQLSAHALILGASGAGKSTTLLRILADHVRRGRPVIAIDLKGSPAFASALADAAGAVGRPFRLWTPDGPAQWNPLAHGNATELKDKLISTERFTEPHYQRAAERYVQNVLQVLLESDPSRPPTLEDVVALMDPHRMAAALRHAPAPLSVRVQDYLSTLTPDQMSAIRGLGTRLAIVSESHVGRHLGGDDTNRGVDSNRGVDLRAALGGREVVLFSLNSSTYGKLAAQIGTLVVQDLVAAVGHRLALPQSERLARPQSDGLTAAIGRAAGGEDCALIAIDEFSALGADNVIALLARGREAGVSVLLATQELADLDRAARGLRDQVLGNTAVKIAHRQDVPASAQTIAQIIGTETSWEHTYQTSARALLGRQDTGRGSRRAVERFIVHPNQIKTLPTGQAVLITKLPVAGTRTVRVAAPRRHDPGGARSRAPRARAGRQGERTESQSEMEHRAR